jgi:5-methylcytosine-specific restriction endonuclease McrA
MEQRGRRIPDRGNADRNRAGGGVCQKWAGIAVKGNITKIVEEKIVRRWMGADHVATIYHRFINCDVCGNEFEAKSLNFTTCSKECREKKGRVGISPLLKRKIMARDGRTCQYCGEKADCIDHVFPVSKGGKNNEENLVACCTSCNLFVFDREFSSFEEKRNWIRTSLNLPQRPAQDKTDWRARVYGGWKNNQR